MSAQLPMTHPPKQKSLKLNVDLINIVLSGIKECPKRTPKLDRFKQDLDNVTNVLHSVDSDFNKQNVWDCFRLGKFKENATRPRSILIKFHQHLDAMSILSNKSSLPNGIVMKPDMTREERKADSLLLEERWCLIQSGVPKTSIKISHSTIYISKLIHGQVTNSVFSLTPQSDNSIFGCQFFASKTFNGSSVTVNLKLCTLPTYTAKVML